jgi:hypothetical protein
MRFEIITPITGALVIASGFSIRIREHLNRSYGSGRWRKMKGFATVRLEDGSICGAEIQTPKSRRQNPLARSPRHRSARPQDQAAHPMTKFVICIDNSGNEASLIVGKVYETVEDATAAEHAMLRVLDEDISEPEGYLYSAAMFADLELPEAVKRELRRYREAEAA